MILTKQKKLAILKGMRSRLAKSKGWVQGQLKTTYYDTYAFGAERKVTGYGFCLAGAAADALEEMEGVEKLSELGMTEEELMRRLSVNTLANAKLASSGIKREGFATFAFNDHRDTRKRDVLALVDEKIAELES